MAELSMVAPAFVEMAHRIVWCTVATVDANSSPRTRVLHPIWEFDGERLVGWIATSPESPKADDLAAHPADLAGSESGGVVEVEMVAHVRPD